MSTFHLKDLSQVQMSGNILHAIRMKSHYKKLNIMDFLAGPQKSIIRRLDNI